MTKPTPSQRKRAPEPATPSAMIPQEAPLSPEEYNREMERREREAMADLRARGENPIHVLLVKPGTKILYPSDLDPSA